MKNLFVLLMVLGSVSPAVSQEFPVLCVPCELAKARDPQRTSHPVRPSPAQLEPVINTMEIIQRKIRQANDAVGAVEGIRDHVNDIGLVSEAVGTVPVFGSSFALASIALRRGNEYYSEMAIENLSKEMELSIRTYVKHLREKFPDGGDVEAFVQRLEQAKNAGSGDVRAALQREVKIAKEIPAGVNPRLSQVAQEIQIESLSKALESLSGLTLLDEHRNNDAISMLGGHLSAFTKYQDTVNDSVFKSLTVMDRRISSLERDVKGIGQEMLFLSFIAERQMDDRTRLEAHEAGVRPIEEHELAEVKTRILIEDVTRGMSTGVQMLNNLSQVSSQIGLSDIAQRRIAQAASLAKKAQAVFSVALSIKTMDPSMALDGIATLLGSSALAGPKDPFVYNAVMDLRADIAVVSRKLDTVIALQNLTISKLDSVRYRMDTNHREAMRQFRVQGEKLDALLEIMNQKRLGAACTDCLKLRTTDGVTTREALDLYRSPVALHPIRKIVNSNTFRLNWGECRQSLYTNALMDYSAQYFVKSALSRQINVPTTTLTSSGGDAIEVQWQILYNLASKIVPTSSRKKLNAAVSSCVKSIEDLNRIAYSSYVVNDAHIADASYTNGLLFRTEAPFMLHSVIVDSLVKTMVAASPFLLLTRYIGHNPIVDLDKQTLSNADYYEWSMMTSRALLMIDYTLAEHALINGVHLLPFVYDSIVRYTGSVRSPTADSNFSAMCSYMNMNPWIARNFSMYVTWRALNESKKNVLQYYFITKRSDSTLIKDLFSVLPVQNLRLHTDKQVEFSFDGKTYWSFPYVRHLIHPEFAYDPITLHLSETQSAVHELRASVFKPDQKGYVKAEEFQSAINLSTATER